jgi:hypothetical protein
MLDFVGTSQEGGDEPRKRARATSNKSKPKLNATL